MDLSRRDLVLIGSSAVIGGIIVKVATCLFCKHRTGACNSESCTGCPYTSSVTASGNSAAVVVGPNNATNGGGANTNSAGAGGAGNNNTTEIVPSKMKAVYETTGAVAQYLLFHYAPLSNYYNYDENITVKQAYGFPIRVAELASKFKPANTKRALDLGCAVGASSFVLSRYFDKVVGVDLSEAFIRAANEMKEKGSMAYEYVVQGSITEHHVARLGDVFPEDGSFNLNRVEFQTGDAETIQLGGFDFILACNLVCRVPHPRKLLKNLANHTNKGGVLVLLTPFSWTEESTSRSEWIGGSEAAGGRSEPIFKKLLVAEGFELVDEGFEPHLIPDHARRFQLGFPMRTVWRKL